MAGIVASDGNISKDYYTVRIVNKDTEFLEFTVKPLLLKYSEKIPKLYVKKSGFGYKNYIMAVYSAKLVTVLTKKFRIPKGSKSKIIKPPLNLSLQEKIDYLRGWIAGDGSVTIDRTRVKIEVWSKNLDIILWFKCVLKEIGIDTRVFYEKNKKEHILRIGRKGPLRVFHTRIEIPHPRKERKLEALLSPVS